LVVLAQHSSANPKDIIMDTKYTFTGDIFGWLGEATPEKLKEGLFNRKGGAPEEVVAADPARDMAQMTVAALGGEDAARKFMINPVTLGPNDYSDLDAWTEAARQSAERVSLMRMERVFDGPEGLEIPPVQPVSTSSLAPAPSGSDLQGYTDGEDDVQSIMPPQGLMSPDIEEAPVVDTSIDDAVAEAMGESEASSDFENILTRRLISEEEFRAEPYQATKGEKFLTIGYGHYGSDVKEGQKLTKEEALTLLKKDINDRLPAIRKAIPAFDSLSDELKVEISQSWFRGGMSGSPETIKLINKGKFKEASKEFLNNKEYMTARERGRAGIIPRMEAVASALEEEAN
jgi:GH24 family phage-related lysozyme (muramidase)